MAEDSMTEEEARRLFVAELIRSSQQGPASDCEEQLTAILAEHEAECAKMRQAQAERKIRRQR